jgi:hypothetical protein
MIKGTSEIVDNIAGCRQNVPREVGKLNHSHTLPNLGVAFSDDNCKRIRAIRNKLSFQFMEMLLSPFNLYSNELNRSLALSGIHENDNTPQDGKCPSRARARVGSARSQFPESKSPPLATPKMGYTERRIKIIVVCCGAMSFDYSLEKMVPFARAAIKPTSNFEIRHFMDALFAELDKAHVPGVARQNPRGQYNYNFSEGAYSPELRRAATEVFFYLVHRGYILPEPQSFPTAFNELKYWKTPRGTAWADGAEPLPEDVSGYMLRLSLLVPSLDSVIVQYIQEGLGSFARESFFPAAVMIGAACEKEIYLLADSLVVALKDPAAQSSQTKQVSSGRSLYRLLEMIRKHIEACLRLRGDFEGALAHLSSLFEAIRVQRNDAVHPSTGTVNEESVRLSYEVFPHAVEKAEKLRAWFARNPASV